MVALLKLGKLSPKEVDHLPCIFMFQPNLPLTGVRQNYEP